MRRRLGPLTFIAVLVLSSVAHADGPKVLRYDFNWQIDADANQYTLSTGFVHNGPFHVEGAGKGSVTEIAALAGDPNVQWLFFQFTDLDGNVVGSFALIPWRVPYDTGLTLHELKKSKDYVPYIVWPGLANAPIPQGLFDNMIGGGAYLKGGSVTFAPGASAFTVDYWEGAHSNTFGVNYELHLEGDAER